MYTPLLLLLHSCCLSKGVAQVAYCYVGIKFNENYVASLYSKYINEPKHYSLKYSTKEYNIELRTLRL